MKIVLVDGYDVFELKNHVKDYLIKSGYQVEDFGAYEYNSTDDYPDYILPAAHVVASSPKIFGVFFGGSGQGEAMAANRLKGVRAVVYYDGPKRIIKYSRQHNDANILSLGARFISKEKAIKVIELWLKTPFEGERHLRRIKKLDK